MIAKVDTVDVLIGTAVLFEYTNAKDVNLDVRYASVTAPALAYISILIDDKEVDGVWIGPGSSHSWWTGAGGKLLKMGLKPGEKLKVTSTAKAAFRLDWEDNDLA